MRERRKASGSNVGAVRRGWSWESGWRDGRSREPAGEEEEDGGEDGDGLRGDDGSSIKKWWILEWRRRRVDAGNQNNSASESPSRANLISLHFVLISAAFRLATPSHQDENILPLQELHGSKPGIISNPN